MIGSTNIEKFHGKERLAVNGYREGRSPRTQKTGKIILPFELEKQLHAEIITQDEYNSLKSMIESNNEGDFFIAEGVINLNRQKRMKKK